MKDSIIKKLKRDEVIRYATVIIQVSFHVCIWFSSLDDRKLWSALTFNPRRSAVVSGSQFAGRYWWPTGFVDRGICINMLWISGTFVASGQERNEPHSDQKRKQSWISFAWFKYKLNDASARGWGQGRGGGVSTGYANCRLSKHLRNVFKGVAIAASFFNSYVILLLLFGP